MIWKGENEDEVKKSLENLVSEQSEGFTFQISIDYKNALNESMKYRTTMENIIHSKSAEILKSEMVDLTSSEVK